MKKKVVALALTCVFMLGLSGYALAGPVTVTVDINAAMPSISSVSLRDSGCVNPVSSLDVWYSSYCMQFTVTSPNRMRQMQSVSVNFYDNGGATPVRSQYRFTTNLQGIENPTWISTDGAQYLVGSNIGSYNWDADSFTFQLLFRFEKYARPTGTSGYWHAYITAQRNPSLIATDDSTRYDVNKYEEISAQTSSITWNNINPGDTLTRQDVNVTVISNIQTDVKVTGAALTEPVDGFTIPVGSFSMQKDTGPPETTLTTSAQAIYTDFYGTAEGVDLNVHGYSNGYARNISFGGTIPDPQPSGTYTGSWTVALDYTGYDPS